MVNVALGSDHGGYRLKQEIIRYLEERGIPYKDFGCGDTSSCDYPEFGAAAAKAVASGEYEKGIVICTTGIGISITANKVKGIRCALCSDTVSARLTREHNDANMLALGAGVGGELKSYTDMMNQARQIATNRMIEEAQALGADAIVGVRYTSSSILQGAAEVMAYGTAAKYQ